VTNAAYLTTYNELRAMGLPPEKCEEGARRAHPTFDDARDVEARQRDAARREKTIEYDGDQQMQAMGWDVVRFSRAERTKQTAGIPDRKYYSARYRLTLWWEAKTPDGVQSPAQRDFQHMAEACGEHYVVGTDRVLCEWLVARGVAQWVEGGFIVSVP